MAEERGRTRVYVWEFPVRLTHWVNVIAIITLVFTGFAIGNPFLYSVKPDSFLMGTFRFIHLLAGYAFLASLIVRFYWAFAGNAYASWRALFPFGKSRPACSVTDNIRYYLFLGGPTPEAAGHTALAGIFYLLMCIAYIVMLATGFALHQQTAYPAFAWVFGGWLNSLFPLESLRLVHHLVMYVIIGAVIVHIYIAWFLDLRENNHLIGSIFDGFKYLTGREKCD